MSCWETDVEKEVKATIQCEDPNITDADTLSTVVDMSEKVSCWVEESREGDHVF